MICTYNKLSSFLFSNVIYNNRSPYMRLLTLLLLHNRINTQLASWSVIRRKKLRWLVTSNITTSGFVLCIHLPIKMRKVMSRWIEWPRNSVEMWEMQYMPCCYSQYCVVVDESTCGVTLRCFCWECCMKQSLFAKVGVQFSNYMWNLFNRY